jgi:hypothetical protein
MVETATSAPAPAYDPIKKFEAEQEVFQSRIDKLKPLKKVPLSASQRQIIIAGIRDGMVDPASTKFGPIMSGVDESGATHYCVWVNSKNGFGGYVGVRPYGGKVVGNSVEDFDRDFYGTNLRGACTQLGISIENVAKPI